jgi:hypothetical protein
MVLINEKATSRKSRKQSNPTGEISCSVNFSQKMPVNRWNVPDESENSQDKNTQ